MDALTLDGLVREIAPAVAGRHVLRVRAAEADAVLLEISGAKDLRLWLDAGRLAPGLYALTRAQARTAQDDAALAGRSRQALLLFRKHLEGRRVGALRRVRGERVLALDLGGASLLLRLAASRALTLVVDGGPVATIGPGEPSGSPPADAPEREWDQVTDDALVRAADAARAAGRSATRGVLETCPGLGPALARLVADGGRGLAALRASLASPRPVLLAARPLEESDDAELARPDAVSLLPVVPSRVPGVALPQPSWSAAAAALLLARLRGARFEKRRRAVVDEAAREGRRAAQLRAHLEEDRRSLPAPEELRRQAEALLASAGATPEGGVVVVPDPYAPETLMRVRVDPAGLPATADRLFAKARRMERARVQVEARIQEVRGRVEEARANEAAARAARRMAELDALPAGARAREDAPRAGTPGVRQYLSSRGLSILVGRGARENHRLTFSVARPDDLWLHARDVPGAHVIVRDPEGRAAAADLREAAEVAAFFSDAARQAQVDVHVTRRKHIRPAKGGAGRVVVGHSDTLRVAPRDPEGRLRKR